MIDDSKIPLLDDLVSRGQLDLPGDQGRLDTDEQHNIEIESDEESAAQSEVQQSGTTSVTGKDELTDDPSLRELIIDEEIRMILDKHMDKAYEEIIRLLNHKISGT